MAQATSQKPDDKDIPSKRELQHEMQKTRESVAETVGEIKETVGQEYEAARETVAGVLDYRQKFQEEPLVWSLGALSAGFALGYTMGYAHKNTKGTKKKSEIAAFADSLIDEFSTVGNTLVMPRLNTKIKRFFGFDFSELLDEIGSDHKKARRRVTAKKRGIRKTTKSRKRKSG